MNILVMNCGSSSLKFQLIEMEAERVIAKGLCERIGLERSRLVYEKTGEEKEIRESAMPDHTAAVSLVLAALTESPGGVLGSLAEIDAVGHRIVHGGERFSAATLIDGAVIEAIEACSDLAPLHNPANLIGIRACQKLMPDTPMAAVFDTAFHQTMPPEAYLYGLPYRFYEAYGLRKYGFHGTSHAYVSQTAARMLQKPYEALKLIVCHLGNGASVSAVRNRKCVDTSMGLTPLEGLMMGTRSGSLDPAAVAFLARKEQKSLDEVMDLLNRESGVLGLSGGLSSDFRDLEEAYERGEDAGVRALEGFCYRVAKYIGAYAAAMDGVDAVCFTAGVGENSDLVRRLVCSRLHYLGVTLNEEENRKRGGGRIISEPGCPVSVLVVPTNEELAIALETRALLEPKKQD